MIFDGKRVLITGGTGSLGTALQERAERESWDVELTILARNEAKIARNRQRFPHHRAEIGDVRDLEWLRTIFIEQDVIIHAAAVKIVPVAEANAREAILTNVVGTMNVAQAAVDVGVGHVIGILTDKQVQPTTTYGATKMCSAALLREANGWGNTLFTAARYGNVIGSNASIFELLLRLKQENKPFLITDARCTRFWLTMEDAIDLIILAAQQEYPGVTIVPKAPASYVLDLFHAVDPDHEIIDIGIRPGEKLHELLIDRVESRHTIDWGSYFVVYPPQSNMKSNLPDGYEYSSDNPARWLSIEELREMADLA